MNLSERKLNTRRHSTPTFAKYVPEHGIYLLGPQFHHEDTEVRRMNKHEKLVRKLRDALDEDKTLQGDLGIREVEEVLLFLLEESAPGDSVLTPDEKIKAGSKDQPGNREFEANRDNMDLGHEDAPAKNEEHVQSEDEKAEDALGNPVDRTENADASLGKMNQSNPETAASKTEVQKVQEDHSHKDPVPHPDFQPLLGPEEPMKAPKKGK